MGRGSEAQDLYPEATPRSIEERRKLEAVTTGGAEKKVPEKVQKKVAKKVAACIAAGIVGSTGTFVALGETGNLPEPVQEWYDQTAEPIRSVFGIEELNRVSSNNPETVFNGLEIEGLSTVWQNNRWEYVDSQDNLVTGYWNEKEGRYEHTADVLKGEWKGLFVNQSLEEVRDKLREDEEWTAENWNNGKMQVPIGFDITKGGIIEEIKALGNIVQSLGKGTVLGVREIPSETIIFSSFPLDKSGSSFGLSDNSANFSVDKDSILFNVTFRDVSQCLIPGNGYPNNSYNNFVYSSEDIVLALGYPVLEVKENDVLPRIPEAFTNIINPFTKENYQLLISANKQKGGLISFSLKNFLKDDKGRFVFIAPNSSEIGEMKSVIKEEMLNVEAEIEKQNLEKNLEESSLIEKSQTAPTISGLEFDKETGFYLAKEINDYGLKKDAKAAIFKNGFLGLIPEVISYFQKQESYFKIPMPFSLEDLEELKLTEGSDSGIDYLIISPAKSLIIYAPLNGLCYDSSGNRKWGPQKGSYQGLNFDLNGETVLTISSKEIKYYSHLEKVEIGDKLGEIERDIFIEEMKFENILKYNDSLVFILPNE